LGGEGLQKADFLVLGLKGEKIYLFIKDKIKE